MMPMPMPLYEQTNAKNMYVGGKKLGMCNARMSRRNFVYTMMSVLQGGQGTPFTSSASSPSCSSIASRNFGCEQDARKRCSSSAE